MLSQLYGNFNSGFRLSAALLVLTIITTSPSMADDLESVAERLSIHGYGEMHINLPRTGTMNEDADNRAEMHRMVIGWVYEFNPTMRFDAEIDFEHNASEIELEYAQIEIDLAPTLSFRAGTMLMPIGPLNEFHEPPNFYSVERPNLYSSIIPTTWQENGLGISGRLINSGIAYRLYVTTALDANGFSAGSGIRGGRSRGVESTLNDVAISGRFEYSPAFSSRDFSLNFGASGYYGGADQDDTALGDVTVCITSGDLKASYGALQAQAVVTNIAIDGAESVSTVVGEIIGEQILGWLIELDYHVYKRVTTEKYTDIVVFIRREQFDTNHKVSSGMLPSAMAYRDVYSGGVAYYPDDKIVFKLDVESWKDGAGQSLERVNAGFGFMF